MAFSDAKPDPERPIGKPGLKVEIDEIDNPIVGDKSTPPVITGKDSGGKR